MTREEASFILANIDRRVCDDELSEALDMAIEALEQEPILDKIRAEIIQMPTISFNANDIYKANVLAIIDKYRESGDEE